MVAGEPLELQAGRLAWWGEAGGRSVLSPWGCGELGEAGGIAEES